MAPSPSNASLPPLPSLPQGGQQQSGGQNDMASIMSGLAPVKAGVDQILGGAKAIVQSGAVPGSEQICGQIVALATSLLTMGAQSAMQSSGGAPGAIGPVGGGPQPIMGGQ